jgi:TldD protein
MMPAPVVRGEWTTPVQIDPFAVSPDAHAKVLGAFTDTGNRVKDGGLDMPARLQWTAETRVFASSDGSLTTQRLLRSKPNIWVTGQLPRVLRKEGAIRLPVEGFAPASAGFESVTGLEVHDRIKATVEEAVRLASYPEVGVNVGRYEAVLDGSAMAAILGGTLAPALELDRVFGREADGVGTSFLAPISQVLGRTSFSPHLTVTANRAAPAYGAAKWDDEGVAVTPFPVIQRGAVVDYFTTRTSAPALAAWYRATGQSVQSRGSAVAWAATASPVGCASQLAMDSGARGATLDALLARMSNGIFIRGVQDRGVATIVSDQQLASGLCVPMAVFEVKRGQITRRVRGAALQFRTTKFWNAIAALGDATTQQHFVWDGVRGETWAETTLPVVAPAAQFRDVDVCQIGSAS